MALFSMSLFLFWFVLELLTLYSTCFLCTPCIAAAIAQKQILSVWKNNERFSLLIQYLLTSKRWIHLVTHHWLVLSSDMLLVSSSMLWPHLIAHTSTWDCHSSSGLAKKSNIALCSAHSFCLCLLSISLLKNFYDYRAYLSHLALTNLTSWRRASLASGFGRRSAEWSELKASLALGLKNVLVFWINWTLLIVTVCSLLIRHQHLLVL